MNLPNRVPVLAKPQEGSSICSLSSAFHTISAAESFTSISPIELRKSSGGTDWPTQFSVQPSRPAERAIARIDNFSAHFETEAAGTPLEGPQSPSSAAICIAKLPIVVLSVEPTITSSPVCSAANRLSSSFRLPPPTMYKRFSVFPAMLAIELTTSAYRAARLCRMRFATTGKSEPSEDTGRFPEDSNCALIFASIFPGANNCGSSTSMSAAGAANDAHLWSTSRNDQVNPRDSHSSMHWRKSHIPLTFFRKQIVPPTPPRFVKFIARASWVTHGLSRTVPTSDQVPELTKAQSSPEAGIAAIADAVSWHAGTIS